MKIIGQNVQKIESGDIRVKINSTFNNAGNWYGFPNHSKGIGFNEGIVDYALKNNVNILVTIGSSKIEYCVSPKWVKEIVSSYNSVYKKGDLSLLVVPVEELVPRELVTGKQVSLGDYQ